MGGRHQLVPRSISCLINSERLLEMAPGGRIITLAQLGQPEAVEILSGDVMGGAEVALGNCERPLGQFQRAGRVAKVGQCVGEEPERERNGRVVGSKGALRNRDGLLGRSLRLEQLALEPELLGHEIERPGVRGMIGISRPLDRLSPSYHRPGPDVLAFALQHPPEVLERACYGSVCGGESCLFQAKASLEDLHRLVVAAGARQRVAEVIEGLRDLEAVGVPLPFRHRHRALDCCYGLVELGCRNQHIADVEERDGQLDAVGSDVGLLDLEHALGQRQRFRACGTAVQDQRPD